jgi:hypothetical protein
MLNQQKLMVQRLSVQMRRSPEIENTPFHIPVKNIMKLFSCELGLKKINGVF